MTISKGLIAVALAGTWILPLQARPARGVDLAAMTDWDIVLDRQASPSETYAAAEFRELFFRASTAKLAIVHEVNRPDRHVFIGPGEALRASAVGFRVAELGEEDLRIVIRNDNIAIAGGRPRGTLYGVYTFLEDYLGVRFLTHDHTHVPQVGDSRIVGLVDRLYQPPLEYRNAPYGENRAYPEFAARLRQNAVAKDPKLGGCTPVQLINHSFYRQVMVEKLLKDHPDYYALLSTGYVGRKGAGGQRSTNWDSQLCLTHPDVLRIVIKAVRDELERRPDARNVSVSQNDGTGCWCCCPNCAAIDEREESHMGSLLTFVNAVADEIAKTHPDVKIGTLAYVYSQKPPKTLRPRPNVQIQLCSVRARPTRPIPDRTCAQNERFRRVLEDWKRICRDIGIWNYNLNHWYYLLPNPNMRVVEPNIRFFVANNVRRVFLQSPHGIGTEFSDLKNYVASRLLWDPSQNGAQLRNEFLLLHYGPAAGPILHYLNVLHDKAEAVTRSYMHFAGNPDNFGIDEKVVQAGLKAFEDALELVGDDKVLRARVEKASIAAYCAAALEPLRWGQENGYSLSPNEEPKPKMPTELDRRTRPYTRRLFDLCEKYGVDFWSEGSRLGHFRALFGRIHGLQEGEPF